MTLPPAAHFPHLEDPEGLAAALSDFVEATEPALIEDGDWGAVVTGRRGRRPGARITARS